MGCGGSRLGGSSRKSALLNVDDSVHVMLKHDKKVQQQKGGPVLGYKERASHPLLKPKAINAPPPGGDANGAGAPVAVPRPRGNGPIVTEEE